MGNGGGSFLLGPVWSLRVSRRSEATRPVLWVRVGLEVDKLGFSPLFLPLELGVITLLLEDHTFYQSLGGLLGGSVDNFESKVTSHGASLRAA